jgi:hypothetical protein
MDQEFQTSFIPKKTETVKPKRSGSSFGLINTISFVLLIMSIIMAGGVYFYRDNLATRVQEMQVSLNRARNIFEPSLLEELRILDKRMRAAREILQGHIAVSPIFNILQETTLPNIRYINFQYELSLANPNLVQVSMTGEATSYDAITLQADLFNRNRFIRNPIFSNFSLNRNGLIDFDLSFDVSRSLVSFEQEVERSFSR